MNSVVQFRKHGLGLCGMLGVFTLTNAFAAVPAKTSRCDYGVELNWNHGIEYSKRAPQDPEETPFARGTARSTETKGLERKEGSPSRGEGARGERFLRLPGALEAPAVG